MTTLVIHVTGLEELRRALRDTPEALARVTELAGGEIGRTVLETEGLRRYPPATAANQPPTPYYVRGRGTQYKRGNLGNSERLGTQYYVETQATTITIGNRATYAPYVSGEEQARNMGDKGWRKLPEVAEEKIDDIVRIYDGWVERELKKLGL